MLSQCLYDIPTQSIYVNHRHLIQSSCFSSKNCMRPALSKSCITISSSPSLKSTTVIWQSWYRVGVCDRPPLCFERSSPVSCPGCQFGCSGLASTVLKEVAVPVRVQRRVRIGEGYLFAPSGSDRIEGGRRPDAATQSSQRLLSLGEDFNVANAAAARRHC